MLQNLKLWFTDKKQLIKQNNELHRILNKRINSWLKYIEELRQESFHLLALPDATNEDMEDIKDALREIKSRMKWSPPEIFIINKKIDQFSKEDLKAALKQIEQKESD